MSGLLSVSNLELLAVLAFSLAVARGAWANRPERGSRPLAAFMLAVAVLAGTHLGAHLAETLFAASLADAVAGVLGRVRWVGFGSVAFVWTAFVLEYTGREGWLDRRGVAVLFAWPAVLVAALCLEPLFAVLVSDPALSVYGSLQGEGTLFWAHILLSYALVAVGSVAVFVYLYRTGGLFRRQGIAVLAGIGAVWAGSVVSTLELLGDVHFHALQVGFLGLGTALFWGVFRAGLTDITPVARSTVLESLTAGVLAVDGEGRITEANPAARSLLGREGERLVGRPASEALAEFPDLVATLGTADERRREVTLRTGGDSRTVRVDVRAIERRGERVGEAVILYDVTEQKRREEELDLTKQVFSRVLRHNLRNDLNTVILHAKRIAREAPEERERLARSIVDISAGLVETSREARTVERLLELDDPVETVDAVAAVEDAVGRVREGRPDATVHVTGPASAPATAHGQFATAVENLVENAVEHGGPGPTVEVTVERRGDRVAVVVEDDGPGIPPQEVAAVQGRTEDPLEHASGIGLHIVRWIVSAADGELTFERTDRGTRATVELAAAGGPDPGTGSGVETPA